MRENSDVRNVIVYAQSRAFRNCIDAPALPQGHLVLRPLRTQRADIAPHLHRSNEQVGNRYGYFLCHGRQDGVCDLPHLPVDKVEQVVVDHYETLNLPTNFVNDVHQLLDEALTEEQYSVAELHAAVSRKLKELETKEDRFLDLLTDDRLPQAKFREKLRKIQIERTATEA